MSLSHATRINWTPKLIEKQKIRNDEREKRLAKTSPAKSTPLSKIKKIPAKRNITSFISSDGEVVLPKECGFVYLITFNNLYKIGMTINIARRMYELERTWHMPPGSYTIVHTIYSPNMIYLEMLLHHKFAHKNVHTEWFNLIYDDITWIIELGNELYDDQIDIIASKIL